MKAYLAGVQYFLPEGIQTNDDLVAMNPSWSASEIFRKTGIRSRRVVRDGETAGDLAREAGNRLLDELRIDRNSIDALLFCTQSPDHFLPTTACILQAKLGLPTTCGAFDFNLGCSGFTYGLWLARALILSHSATNVLLLTGETLSKYCNPHDAVTVTIFGDGGGAALITAEIAGTLAEVGPSVVGTDGRGAPNLIVPAGGARCPKSPSTALAERDAGGNLRGPENIFMDGAEVFGFTLSSVHVGIAQLLEVTGLQWGDIDYYMLHQANGFILESLRRKMKIAADKFPVDMESIGNTACSSIPILLRRCMDRGQLKTAKRCVLAGYGVGYSWAMTLLNWHQSDPI